jgi:hypothetical protein
MSFEHAALKVDLRFFLAFLAFFFFFSCTLLSAVDSLEAQRGAAIKNAAQNANAIPIFIVFSSNL